MVREKTAEAERAQFEAEIASLRMQLAKQTGGRTGEMTGTMRSIRSPSPVRATTPLSTSKHTGLAHVFTVDAYVQSLLLS